jgi:hypothetical protein
MFFSTIVLFTVSCIGAEDKSIEQASAVAKDFISYSLENSLVRSYDPRRFYHPDALWPGSDRLRIAIVCTDYRITDTKKQRLSVNMMEPKEEEIVIVTVSFPLLGIVSGDKLESRRGNATKVFYLSKSTGKYLIIDMSEPNTTLSTLDHVRVWAAASMNESSRVAGLVHDLSTLDGCD